MSHQELLCDLFPLVYPHNRQAASPTGAIIVTINTSTAAITVCLGLIVVTVIVAGRQGTPPQHGDAAHQQHLGQPVCVHAVPKRAKGEPVCMCRGSLVEYSKNNTVFQEISKRGYASMLNIEYREMCVQSTGRPTYDCRLHPAIADAVSSC